jgi:tetratricopeptide (TPR) repeat protein
LEREAPDPKVRPAFRGWGLLRWGVLALTFAGVAIVHVAPSMGYAPVASLLPSFQLQLARSAFSDAGNRLTPAIATASQGVGAAAPLEAVPFYFRAIALEAEGREQDVLPLLDEALRRDPRHYYARLWRARIYYGAGRIPDAVDEVLKVIPLNQKGAQDYVEALVDVARDETNRPLLLDLVATRPGWAQAFMQRVDAEIPDDGFHLALASLSPDTLNRYIARLIDEGEYDRALLIWQGAWSEEQLLTFSWPADPRFSVEKAGQAFGWQTDSRTTSRAADGLHIFHNGRGVTTVASQTMLLGPGYTYRVTVDLSGEFKERGGWFRWRMACRETGEVLGELAVRSVDPDGLPPSFDVAAPADDCPAQLLSLNAERGEYVFAARLVVRQVQIDQLAAVQVGPAEPAVTASAAP